MDYLGGGGPSHSLESGSLLADLDAYLFYRGNHGFWDRLFNGSRSLDNFWGGNDPPLIPREGWAATTGGTATYFLNQALLGVPAFLAGGSSEDADLWSPDQRKYTHYVDAALVVEGARTLPRLLQQLERGNIPGQQLVLASGRGDAAIPGSATASLGSRDWWTTLMAENAGTRLIGTATPEGAWATKTGRAYDRRFRTFWREHEGKTVNGWEVKYVNRRVAPGIQPDLVLINHEKKLVSIRDITSMENEAHMMKGMSYEAYFRQQYPGYTVRYEEIYWRGKTGSVEAEASDGLLYFPDDFAP